MVWPGGRLALSERTHVMGIVNVTPDSFSDGGLFLDPDAAVKRGLGLCEEGADVLDIGGESTRPGADPVDAAQEIARVVPVIEALAARAPVPISIDTMKASVAEAALDAGAQIINDVSAGTADQAMLGLAAAREVPIVLMHMRGDPRTMQTDPTYDDVVADVRAYLDARARAAIDAGIPADRIIVDPGFGFGKKVEHNLAMLRRFAEFTTLGYPVMAATSRKSFVGAALGLPVGERLEGSLATVAIAVHQGASIVRVHDVEASGRVVGMVDSITRSTRRNK